MSIISSNSVAPPPVAAGGSGGSLSSISDMNSLRFDGTSYLSRTFGSGDTKKFTYSLWGKFGNANGESLLFAQSGPYTSGISKTDILAMGMNGNTHNVQTEAKIRDYSSWYHLVCTYDVAQSDTSMRAYISINGVKITETNSINSGFFPQNYSSSPLNTACSHYIGLLGTYNTYPLNGYLANIHFIDGQALDASHFGQEISGVWVPKQYDPATSGAYGTNGFHLDFADSGNIGNDVSGNGNHWTVN